jgi:hypothetical protein
MSWMLSWPRVHLQLVIFCITVLFSVGAAFPGKWLFSTIASSNDQFLSRSSCIKRDFSSPTPLKSTDRVEVSTKRHLEPLVGENDSIAKEKEIVRKYIQSLGSSSTKLEHFHIHGWRWHTRSLIREVGRLHALALKTNLPNVEHIQKATEYVIGFNLRGLHKIEADLFFPWMRQQLTLLPRDSDLSNAFAAVMTELEEDRLKVSRLGESILQNAHTAGNTRTSPQVRSGVIKAIAEQTLELQTCARSMMDLEDNYLVPAVAALVDEKEQQSFNSKVLRGLGLLDSRLHLVSMYEAVVEDKNRVKEEELFRKAIPAIPQMMIPRWKRKLYGPKTYMLE